MTMLQIDWLQPIYTFTFSNGLIACLVFMGIGVLLDVGLSRPVHSPPCSLRFARKSAPLLHCRLQSGWDCPFPDAGGNGHHRWR